MSRLSRLLWPAACVTAMVVAGCDSQPPNDQTDPLPKVFNNEDVDLSNVGPGSGTGTGGGMGRGGGGGRHAKGPQDGSGGGNMDGTGGGHQKAKLKKDGQKPAGESRGAEAEKTGKTATGDEPKKSAPPGSDSDSGKQEKKERSEKDEP